MEQARGMPPARRQEDRKKIPHMDVDSNQFIPKARIAIGDPQLQAALAVSTTNSISARAESLFAFGREHGEHMRQQAAEAKRRALRHLPDLLEQAEARMQANGMHVLWAEDASEANRLVLDLIDRHEARRIVKSKSTLTEEIGLNTALESHGLDVLETDLGAYIVQIAGEHPSHIVGPALHMSKDTIRDLFVRELAMPPTDDAEQMTQFVRERLRRAFLEADLGICGGNFIIAETGSLCLSTNEGNGRMVTTLPRVLVAIVGIEKVVETVEDFTTLAQMLSRSNNGQVMTVYTQMIHGPRRPNETDGPEEIYVILVDNGRSAIYATAYAEALACIRCGACLSACPVYRTAGGHAYGSIYSGPIGAVITPLLAGLENATPLPYASSLCGMCKDVCPVRIDLPRMLLDLRHDLVEQGHSPALWSMGLRSWAAASGASRLFTLARRGARWGLRLAPRRLPGPLDGWTRYRNLPPPASRSFYELWRDRQEGRDHE